MAMKKLLIYLVILGVLAAAVFLYVNYSCRERGSLHTWCYIFESQKIQVVDSFERCIGLGFPVMESFPRRCRAGDKTFTEIIEPRPVANDKIRIFMPLSGAVIKSPLILKGEARGNWYFEASFPIRLLDADGNLIPLDPPYVMTTHEWMTTDFVPFETTHIFSVPSTDSGTLILQKDNPSGLPEFDDSISVPVRFK